MNIQDKIYVAGNTGLVGSAIVRKLKENGFENLVFTPFSQYDLRNQEQVNRFFEKHKPRYVFLAAAKVGGIHANSTYPAEFIYDNLMIEANIIHAAHLYGTQKLLFLGSSCIYPKLSPQPIKEEYLLTGELEPTNEPYAIAKIAGIKLCEYYKKQYGSSFISAMPTNLFGPGDNYHLQNSHVLPAMIRKMYLAHLWEQDRMEEIRQNFIFHEGQELSDDELIKVLADIGITDNGGTIELALWGTGTPRREFLFVNDLADALLFLMQNYDGVEHVNVGMGKDSTIAEISGMIKQIVGFEGPILWNTDKPDGTPQKLLDVSKLYGLGWKPQHSFSESLGITFEHYKENTRKKA